MKISMWMLYDALGTKCRRHNLDDKSKRICIKGILPYLAGEVLSEDYLYVADAGGPQPLVISGDPSFIAFFGENFLLEGSNACQFITLESSSTYSSALYGVCKAFERYSEWQAELQAELNGAQNLNRLCALGSLMLENFIMLYDREYNIIAGEFAMSNALHEFYIEKNGPNYVLSAEAIRQLKSNSGFQQTFRQSGAAVLKVDFLSYAVLYVNLGLGNTYEGRLCVTDSLRPFKNSDYQVAEILTDFLRLAIKRQTLQSSGESRKFESVLLNMLDGHVPDSAQLDAALHLWHWKRTGRYLCIRISLDAIDAQTSSDLYLLSKIALSLQGSCAVRFQDGIDCVVSLTSRERVEDIIEKLGRFLVGFITNIGVSDIYQDFIDTALYHRQAVIAAEMGALDVRKNWCRFFRDYAMAHYFRYGTSVLPAIHYCDENVKRLIPYQDTKTDYYSTLKAYLENNMNLLETSQALFIHRTTLFNRINKIRELISADINNPEDRVRMLISFKLMEADKTYRRV